MLLILTPCFGQERKTHLVGDYIQRLRHCQNDSFDGINACSRLFSAIDDEQGIAASTPGIWLLCCT
jgi:hypothetical protein